MGHLIIAAGLFTGEATEHEIVFNPRAVANGEEAESAHFQLMPITPGMELEYQTKLGNDVQTIGVEFKEDVDPEELAADPRKALKLQPMTKSMSASRKAKADKWLLEKVCKGWRGVQLDNGTELMFSGKNLAMLAPLESFSGPILAKARELTMVRAEVEEGNSET